MVLFSNYVIWDNWVNNIFFYGICYLFWRCFFWVWIGWLVLLLVFIVYFLFIVYMLLEKYFKCFINIVII